MTDEIRPALSAEEWGHARVYADEGRGADHFRAEAGPMTWIEPHKVAALALYGQPFGFTWEDVDELLAQAERSDFADRTGDNSGYGMYGGHCRDLAARIAALLPPREEG